MNFHIKKSRISKLLLPITTLIVLVFIINQVSYQHRSPAQETEASRLKALESAIYYDKNTGLEWLTGPDRRTTWYKAKRWVESLTAVAGGDWRMPTRKEIITLYEEGTGKYNMTRLLKKTVRKAWIWSGETYDSSFETPCVWVVFGRGRFATCCPRDGSNDFSWAFAVRSRR